MTSAVKKFISIDDVKTCYHECGDGPPLLLLHGAGPGASGFSNFKRNIDALAKQNHVIVPDLPGFGESDNALPPGLIFGQMAAFTLKFMDALGIQQASFVGNSMGGGISLFIALHHARRAKNLVLMGSAGSTPIFTPMLTEGLKRMLGFYAPPGPSMERLRGVIEQLVYDQSAITEELLTERYAVATRPEIASSYVLSNRGWEDLWRENLAGLAHPTLIIWGREDRVMPLDAGLLLMRTIPNAQFTVYPKCGHWAQWEHADAFNAQVSEFLARNK